MKVPIIPGRTAIVALAVGAIAILVVLVVGIPVATAGWMAVAMLVALFTNGDVGLRGFAARMAALIARDDAAPPACVCDRRETHRAPGD